MLRHKVLAATVGQLLMVHAAHAATSLSTPTVTGDSSTSSSAGSELKHAGLPPAPTQLQGGANFVVNATDDAGDGSCGVAIGECTLRDAVIAANSDSNASMITFDTGVFASAQTVTLTMGQMVVSSAISIVGPGEALLTLDANSASRHFLIDDGDYATNLDVALSGMTLINGLVAASGESGGAINNRENLKLDAVAMNANSARSAGGALYSNAPLASFFSLSNSVLIDNRAGASGGAEIRASIGSVIEIAGNLITGNLADGNSTGVTGGGMSLILEGTKLDLRDSTFSENIQNSSCNVTCRGAGLFVGATSGLTRLAQLKILNNVGAAPVSGPNSSARGAGMYLSQTGGIATISQTTISDNRAEGDPSGFSGLNTLGGGAYVTAQQSSIKISRTTVSGNSSNQANGGMFLKASDSGAITLVDSTVSGNSCLLGGGGIYASVDAGSTVSIHGSTIVDNVAGSGFTLGAPQGAGILSQGTGDLNVAGTVIAGNTDLSSNPATDLLLQSSGYMIVDSLIGDNTGSGLIEAPIGMPDANNNLIGDPLGAGIIDARLGPLLDNGGLTMTHYPLVDSPLIDRYNGCSGTDQIGNPRGLEVNGNPAQPCDIGAVEFAGDLIFTDGFDPAVIVVAYEDHAAKLHRKSRGGPPTI